jgi:hypothetical protein
MKTLIIRLAGPTRDLLGKQFAVTSVSEGRVRLVEMPTMEKARAMAAVKTDNRQRLRQIEAIARGEVADAEGEADE